MKEHFHLYGFKLGTQKFNKQGELSTRSSLWKSIRESLEDGEVNYILIRVDRNDKPSNDQEIHAKVEDAMKQL